MSAYKSPIEYTDFASLLTCPLCHMDFVQPLLLPCLHSLCRCCLKKYIDASVDSSAIQCPSCGKQCKVPEAGVSSFQPNYFAQELKAILTNRTKRLLAVNTNNDGGFANSGSGSSYESSGEQDKVDKATASRGPPMCIEHPGEQLDVFCWNCKMSLCSTCSTAPIHKLHWRKKLATLARDYDKELMQLTESLECSLLRLRRISDDLDNKQRQMMEDLEQATRTVTSNADRLRSYIDQQETLLQEKIRTIARDGVELVATEQREVELGRRAVHGLQDYVDGLAAVGTLYDQAVHLPGLKHHIKEQDARVRELKTVRWMYKANEGSATLQQITAMLGDVSAELAPRSIYWPNF